jgi:hypothetical protein
MDSVEARYLGHGHRVLHWNVTTILQQVHLRDPLSLLLLGRYVDSFLDVIGSLHRYIYRSVLQQVRLEILRDPGSSHHGIECVWITSWNEGLLQLLTLGLLRLNKTLSLCLQVVRLEVFGGLLFDNNV